MNSKSVICHLSSCVQTCNSLLIAGDFNIHMDVGDHADKLRMCDLLSMYNLKQHVNASTHRSGHTLDLTITGCDDEMILSNLIVDFMISDHMFVCCKINMPRPALNIRSVTYRKLKNIVDNDFRSDLRSIASHLLTVSDTNILAHSYDIQLRILIDKHAPLKVKTIVERPTAPWFDGELKDLKSYRRRAEK